MTDPLSYEDKEGNTLYGFSQRSLDNNTKWIKRLVFVIGFFGAGVLAYTLWLTYYVISHGVVNNIVARCVGG